MLAGMNAVIDIFRTDANADDIVGGPTLTGTVVLQNRYARIEGVLSPEVLAMQGIETNQLYSVIVPGHTPFIFNNDVIFVKSPVKHRLYSKYLRIVSIGVDSLIDPRRHLELTASIIERTQRSVP
jgi:hypothetical protein